MSMHKQPLTDLERSGLEAHGLDIGTPSQLSDVFRQGIQYALAQSNQTAPVERLPASVEGHGPTPITDEEVVDKSTLPNGYIAIKTDTLLWLLGENGDFECPPSQYFCGKPSPYFWRKNLREAILTPVNEDLLNE